VRGKVAVLLTEYVHDEGCMLRAAHEVVDTDILVRRMDL